MKIIRGVNRNCNIKDPVIALGNFDGIHIGHQSLIKKTVDLAKEIKGTPALFTFYPHPLKIIKHRYEPFIIQTFKEKVKITQGLGIEAIICARFTKEFANMHPKDFVEEILINNFHVRYVCVGHDYTFGEKGKGGIKSLKEYSDKFGFDLAVIPPVKINGIIVSSTKIREFLRQGDIENANRFLGRAYKISGIVKKGDSRGASLGFPTANIYPKNEIILRNGVYAAYVYIKSKRYRSAVNVGFNPTFSGKEKHIEAFLIDFDGDIYGEKIEIEFVDFVRSEKRFRRIQDLVKQIQRDVKYVKSSL